MVIFTINLVRNLAVDHDVLKLQQILLTWVSWNWSHFTSIYILLAVWRQLPGDKWVDKESLSAPFAFRSTNWLVNQQKINQKVLNSRFTYKAIPEPFGHIRGKIITLVAVQGLLWCHNRMASFTTTGHKVAREGLKVSSSHWTAGERSRRPSASDATSPSLNSERGYEPPLIYDNLWWCDNQSVSHF